MTDSAAPATLDSADGEQFVDLYAILGVRPGAPVQELRRRIGALYTEAQDNLEHRNFRKRFYYLELYEVHLPHAHHVLLDEVRRVEYNTELARRRGAKRLAEISSLRNSGSATPAPAAPRSPEPRPAPRPQAPSAPQATKTTSEPLPAPAWQRMDRETVERRRDSNRRELIKNELQAAGRRAAAGAGVAAFAGTGLVLGFAAGALGAGLYLQCLAALPGSGAAFFAGRAASRGARRNIIATLSQMPYEELLMRYSH